MSIKTKMTTLVSVTVVVVAALAGCTDSGADADNTDIVFPSTLPPLAALAVLDLDRASIVLPLSAYGMSWEDERIVRAAQQLVFGQCVMEVTTPPAASIDAARRVLLLSPPSGQWFYGFWDESYIATYGWTPILSQVGVGDGLPVSSEVGMACAASDEYSRLSVVDTSTYTNNTVTRNLVDWTGEAAMGMRDDPRFLALVADRNQCLADQGFSIDADSELGGVKWAPTASGEEQLRAVLAEAACSDKLNFTQQAADINAAYEQVVIDLHEAELIAIKAEADKRVAEARGILQTYGVL